MTTTPNLATCEKLTVCLGRVSDKTRMLDGEHAGKAYLTVLAEDARAIEYARHYFADLRDEIAGRGGQ